MVLYEDVEVKYVPGLPPKLILLSETDEELQSIDLAAFSFNQLHELFAEYGFVKKKIDVNEDSQVADDMQNLAVIGSSSKTSEEAKMLAVNAGI